MIVAAPEVIDAMRMTLAGLFATAGCSKWLELAATRRLLRDFGVSSYLAGILGVMLAGGESLIALAMLPSCSTAFGAVGALVTSTTFAAGLAVQLLRGHHPGCFCFGYQGGKAISWFTFARNAWVMAVSALLIVAGPQTQRSRYVTDFSSGTVIDQLAFSVATCTLLFGLTLLKPLLRRYLELVKRRWAPRPARALRGSGLIWKEPSDSGVTALTVGRIPSLVLRDTTGMSVGLRSVIRGKGPVVLVFTQPGCGPCADLRAALPNWTRDNGIRACVIMISRNCSKVIGEQEGHYGTLAICGGREVIDSFAISGLPSGILVLEDGSLGSRLCAGTDAIKALIEWAGTSSGAANSRPRTSP
jgi:hypothetical protein